MRRLKGEEVHYLPGARGVAGLFLMALLAGCGGSGGDESTRTEISTNAISFSAPAPDAATPATQVFTATFGDEIAHLAVVHSGAAISAVTSTMNGRTATITVEPVAPNTVGPGTYIGAVAVTGYTCADATCGKLAAGATSTVAVSYQVSPVVQFVTPYVETAGVADEVILRGVGFNRFLVEGVRFGDVAATAITQVNASEIRATHPALPAGDYPVRLVSSNHQGVVPTTATLRVRNPVVYAATTLAYPTAATEIRGLVYDAERTSLLAVTDAGGGSLIRYPYTGGAWGAPTEVAAGLRDVALSAAGTTLNGITSTTYVPIDPVALTIGTAITAPSMTTDSFLKSITVGNDDIGLITTGIAGSTPTTPYLYSPFTSALIAATVAINNASQGMSANGATAYLIQGDPTTTTDLPVYEYTTNGNGIATATFSLHQNGIPPVLARNETRLVMNGVRVYDQAETFLAVLPGTTGSVVLRPDGKRAYTYDRFAGGILTFDTSVDPGEVFPALGPVTPISGDPGQGVRMIISPDGGTLFIAGSNQIVVQPTPAL
ncbi:MAG: IPT/TIG domain-containing protein [Steroidobacter sp.]